MTPFYTPNLLTMFRVHFFSFPVSKTENFFGWIFTTVQGTDTTRIVTEQTNLKIGPGWISFALETYPDSLGCNSYRFSSIHLKNIFVKFWWLFQARKKLEQEKLKIEYRWLGLALETYPHCRGCSSYRFPLIRLKNGFVEFWQLFQTQKAPLQANLKTGPGWFDFAPETYLHCLGCSSYRFPSVQLKNISIKFWRLFQVRKTAEQERFKIGHK